LPCGVPGLVAEVVAHLGFQSPFQDRAGHPGEEFFNTVAALSEVVRCRDEGIDLVGAQNAFKGVGGHTDFGQEGPSFQG